MAQGLAGRYARIYDQLAKLFADYGSAADSFARMATIAALLHHKMPHFFWTGFYRWNGEDLVVGPYQGPLACAVLERGKGVCLECIRQEQPLLVGDVHAFPGHIPCDSRSRSEVVVPLWSGGRVVGVLDVDSDKPEAFSPVDVEGLERIAGLVFD